MTAVVCISNDGGMLFNKRRQSRDRLLIEDFASLSSESTVFISEFSSSLFEKSNISVIATSNPLFSAEEGDFAFVEDRGLLDFKDKIKTLIIYKWNRDYPSDFKLDLNPENENMHLSEIFEFPGKSHEKITRERWER